MPSSRPEVLHFADLKLDTGTHRAMRGDRPIDLTAKDVRASAAFYESAGWAPDGWARTLDTGGEPLREVRWHALLGPENSTADGTMTEGQQ